MTAGVEKIWAVYKRCWPNRIVALYKDEEAALEHSKIRKNYKTECWAVFENCDQSMEYYIWNIKNR